MGGSAASSVALRVQPLGPKEEGGEEFNPRSLYW